MSEPLFSGMLNDTQSVAADGPGEVQITLLKSFGLPDVKTAR